MYNSGRNEQWSGTTSEACQEKLRRDKLNGKYALYSMLSLSLSLLLYLSYVHIITCVNMFVELASILEPGRKSKTDKAAILVGGSNILFHPGRQEKDEPVQKVVSLFPIEVHELSWNLPVWIPGIKLFHFIFLI